MLAIVASDSLREQRKEILCRDGKTGYVDQKEIRRFPGDHGMKTKRYTAFCLLQALVKSFELAGTHCRMLGRAHALSLTLA